MEFDHVCIVSDSSLALILIVDICTYSNGAFVDNYMRPVNVELQIVCSTHDWFLVACPLAQIEKI